MGNLKEIYDTSEEGDKQGVSGSGIKLNFKPRLGEFNSSKYFQKNPSKLYTLLLKYDDIQSRVNTNRSLKLSPRLGRRAFLDIERKVKLLWINKTIVVNVNFLKTFNRADVVIDTGERRKRRVMANAIHVNS